MLVLIASTVRTRPVVQVVLMLGVLMVALVTHTHWRPLAIVQRPTHAVAKQDIVSLASRMQSLGAALGFGRTLRATKLASSQKRHDPAHVDTAAAQGRESVAEVELLRVARGTASPRHGAAAAKGAATAPESPIPRENSAQPGTLQLSGVSSRSSVRLRGWRTSDIIRKRDTIARTCWRWSLLGDYNTMESVFQTCAIVVLMSGAIFFSTEPEEPLYMPTAVLAASLVAAVSAFFGVALAREIRAAIVDVVHVIGAARLARRTRRTHVVRSPAPVRKWDGFREKTQRSIQLSPARSKPEAALRHTASPLYALPAEALGSSPPSHAAQLHANPMVFLDAAGTMLRPKPTAPSPLVVARTTADMSTPALSPPTPSDALHANPMVFLDAAGTMLRPKHTTPSSLIVARVAAGASAAAQSAPPHLDAMRPQEDASPSSLGVAAMSMYRAPALAKLRSNRSMLNRHGSANIRAMKSYESDTSDSESGGFEA